ncbi:MAG: hypothetical protein RL091_2065 [Verrucomicrobiota bacterium]
MSQTIASTTPPLESGFEPAARWNRRFRGLVARDPQARSVALALARPDGTVLRHDFRVLSAAHPQAAQNLRYAERLLKFLLWQQGGSQVLVAGASDIGTGLAAIYSSSGERAFDRDFMGGKVYASPLSIENVQAADIPVARESGITLGRHLKGCRIGFDLGGSDRKVAALVDGKVVFSEETRWDPYFQTDPAYHLQGIQQSLERAAAHLPRVDAIGGSAAGVYVNNEVRVASLFRGVPPDRFEREVRRMFFQLRERWGGIPLEVVNDGEVTALAGSMALGDGAVLGISMGTSQAAGYVRSSGEITSWLNELAFAPVDYSPTAPRDEWSGDIGCGVQYFSQQGIARLATKAGFTFPTEVAAPERLVAVQEAMARGDPRAAQIFITVGRCFGHALAHYADFYDLRHVLVLGRVTSGEGGALIMQEARNVLQAEYAPLGERISISMPDEHHKRHGQAIAAASLPALMNH